MLTADLIKPRLRVRGDMLTVDMIDPANVHWLRTAFELIALFQAQVGQTAAAWESAVERYEGERVDYVVVRGLAKVSRKSLETALFADRPAAYILTEVEQDWTPEALLSRYNLELSRGVLYWSSKLHLEIHDTYKDLWRYLKLFKLMFEAKAIDDGYSLELDGPISPFVRTTTRYGRQFAAFLPALLLCDQWQMAANVRPPQGGHEVLYRLDDTTSLCGYFKRSGHFDSQLESDGGVLAS